MSTEVKRYDAVHIRYEDNNIRYGEGCEVEVVTASDYAALEAENARLQSAFDDLAERYGKLQTGEGSLLAKVVTERDALSAEAEALRGLTPELPPRPPEGAGLPRYGLRWNGPAQPLSVPMDDGYWTPWHLAEALRAENAALRESSQDVRSLVEALEECAASLAWNCLGECRAIHAGPIMPAAMALDTARAALYTLPPATLSPEVQASGPYASVAGALAQRYPKPSLLKDCNVSYSSSSRPLAEQGERQEAVVYAVHAKGAQVDHHCPLVSPDMAADYLPGCATPLYTTPQPAPAQDVAGLASSDPAAKAEFETRLRKEFESRWPRPKGVTWGAGINDYCVSDFAAGIALSYPDMWMAYKAGAMRTNQ